ncbi:hypothetical protein GCM10023195_47990 [Actinoallomurus liliacearum]|uniref:Alpha/beta hydrolase n=1 Tax=Actinoallomurus liliacearum TaxID=1080073 RepID=A0ABP8TQ81_9ACTN
MLGAVAGAVDTVLGPPCAEVGVLDGQFADEPGELKEIHWVDGAGHVDLYDRKQYVDLVVEKLAGFFAENLGE